MATHDHIAAAAPAPAGLAGDYEDFQPFCTWQTTESHHILRLHLHGFRKDQMRVRLKSRGILLITGECPAEEANEHSDDQLSGRRRLRGFRKEIKVSKSWCQSPGEIRAKFSAGVLAVTLPLEANPRDHQDDRISINLESAPLYCSVAAMSRYFSRLQSWFENMPRLGKVCLVLLVVALLIGLVAALSFSFWITIRPR